jgi:biopolymer transport protein ExbB
MEDFFVVDIVDKGGILMAPIIACSLIALAVTLERFFTLRRSKIDTRDFMDTIRTVLKQKKIADAIDICDATAGPIARILKAALLKHDRSKEDIRDAIEDAGQLEIPRLERYLGVLGTIANVAPMLGLLGTVQGMIKAFAQIQQKMGAVNPSDLAEGIGNALVTTAAGLTVAIPTLIAYNYFISRVNNFIVEMEISSSELVDLLTAREGGFER